MVDFRQLKWDTRYLRLASEVGGWSKDPSTKVGAILVRPNNSVASTGYNGFPPGHDDSPELYADRAYKYAHVVHAEVNALDFFGGPAEGFTLYTSFPCCVRCVERAAKEKVSRLVCPPLPTEGRDAAWIEHWLSGVAQAMQEAKKRGIIWDTRRV